MISFPLVPERLLHPDLVVDTVVDSWDHPVRRTAGFESRLAIAWNEDLARDWQQFQGASGTFIGPPVKLEYALRSPIVPSMSRVLLYPVATSRHYQHWFAEEIELLRSIARSAEVAGWDLLVKPKPESTPDEFALLREHPNVSLGQFHEASGALDYYLGPDYNKARLTELDGASVVLNSLSTFGLDAACAGMPLLQLDLRQCVSLPVLSGVARNHHLLTHLYPLAASGLFAPSSLDELESSLSLLLKNEPGSMGTTASENLRAWVSGGVAADVHALVAEILK